MKNNIKIQEKFLYKIWSDQHFKDSLETLDGKRIEIIDTGTENKDNDGPDFKNSRIKIGNLTFQGDVEIDNYHSDWMQHGHNFNKKYNKVILHVIFNHNGEHGKFVVTRDGRKIPTLCIANSLNKDLNTSLQKSIIKERKERIDYIPCREVSNNVEEKYKIDFIQELGIERFEKKCERIIVRLKELVFVKELNLKEPVVNYEIPEKFQNREFTYKDFSDTSIWEQLIYEAIFEALGYTANKDIMKKLAQAVNLDFLRSLNTEPDKIKLFESLYFNVAGMLDSNIKISDEETSTYVRELSENWDKIKPGYDSKTFYKSHWHFAKLRPHNFPTIRLAGGVRILEKLIYKNLVKNILSRYENTSNLKDITKYLRNQLIIPADGFWENHYVFENSAKTKIKYFIGVSRADDIIVNVILPVTYVYFNIFGKVELAKNTLNHFLNFKQKSDNRLVNNMSRYLSLKNINDRSALHQGIINLYRNYCSKNLCMNCRIGKKVFD